MLTAASCPMSMSSATVRVPPYVSAKLKVSGSEGIGGFQVRGRGQAREQRLPLGCGAGWLGLSGQQGSAREDVVHGSGSGHPESRPKVSIEVSSVCTQRQRGHRVTEGFAGLWCLQLKDAPADV